MVVQRAEKLFHSGIAFYSARQIDGGNAEDRTAASAWANFNRCGFSEFGGFEDVASRKVFRFESPSSAAVPLRRLVQQFPKPPRGVHLNIACPELRLVFLDSELYLNGIP